MAVVWNRINTVLLLLVLFALLAVIGMLATGVRGGPLDPPGAPASTMKALDDIPGSWHRTLNSANGSAGPSPPAGCNSDRFKCLNHTTGCSPFCVVVWHAVLDLETGLVWERTPSTAPHASWFDAQRGCEDLLLGHRYGWRLPTVEELLSLADDSPDGLPDGHPFITSTSVFWWTDSTASGVSTAADVVRFSTLPAGSHQKSFDGDPAWCVRGGYGYDGG